MPARRPRLKRCATATLHVRLAVDARQSWMLRCFPRSASDRAAAMGKRVTSDHGEIIHFAGRLRLFPVAKSGDLLAPVRLAGREDVQPDEVRVGWPAYFRHFIDHHLVFLYDEQGGRAVTREQARAEAAEGPAGPAGEASPPAAGP